MSKVIVDEIQTDTTNGNVRVIPNGTGALEVKGAGGDDAILQLNCSAQSHGVKLKSPAHSAGQSYTMILPDNNIAADKYLKVKSIASGSGTSAVGQLEFADVAAGVTSDAQFNTVAGTNAGDSFTGTDALYNTLIGYDAGTAMTTGDRTVSIGYKAGTTTTTQNGNVFVGSEAGENATTGNGGNVYIGNRAARASTTSAKAVAIGELALYQATVADYTVAIGNQAGNNVSTGTNNVFIGDRAGSNITTGSNNICIGKLSDASSATATKELTIGAASGDGEIEKVRIPGIGSFEIKGDSSSLYIGGGTNAGAQGNTSVGHSAANSLTTGYYNTIYGNEAGKGITTGYQNVAIGYGVMSDEDAAGSYANVAIGQNAFKYGQGYQNVAVGWGAMRGASSQDVDVKRNVAVGYKAAYSLNENDGDENTCVGYQAGMNLTSGQNNVLIGNDAGTSNAPGGNITTGNNRLVLGDLNIGFFYCADTSISSSDSRDKTDVTSFNIGLNWIEALRPVTYRWDRRVWYGTDEMPFGTPDGSKKRPDLHIGFLAQEALEVEKANGYGSNNEDSLICDLTEDGMSYGLKYERLVPILVNAIKELSTRVKTLEGG